MDSTWTTTFIFSVAILLMFSPAADYVNTYVVGYSYAEVTDSPEMCHLQDPAHLRAVKG